jgi:hypothetical protein
MRIPFAVASYLHRSLPISAQRLINLFPESQPPTAKAPTPLLPTPGLLQFSTLPQAPFRGAHVMGQDLYVVAATDVIRINVNGTSVALGSIPNGGPVSMDSNGEDLCIVIPETSEAYTVNRTSGVVAKVTDPDFGGASSVCVIDGYYIFSSPNSGEFFISAINDPTSFDALDFATAEGAADNIITVARVGRDLWLFGSSTIEIWSNVGATDFPFMRISGGFITRGTSAQFSVATRAGTAIWLGDDRVVYAADGVRPQRISTHAIEQALAGYETVADAVGWVYELEGHAFYVLTFPDAGDTWVFDFATGLWHERESEGLGVWRATRGVAFAGGVVAGDTDGQQLWLLDPTRMTEGGAQIIRVATGTPLHAEGKKVFFSRLAAEFECGVGLASGQGSDPTVWLAWSDDGGRTWSNDASASIGRQGVYRARAEWRRLGAARDRVFRLQWADPVFTSLAAVNIEAEAGDG